MDFNWNLPPHRPLTRADVWELLRAGCNTAEIACAAGVSEEVAAGMIVESMPRKPRLGLAA